MSTYLRMEGPAGPILFEIDAEDIETPIAKAGIREKVSETVGQAAIDFRELVVALKATIETLATEFEGMKARPKEIEIAFGLKVTGELGNLAFGKLGGEGNFGITLTWK